MTPSDRYTTMPSSFRVPTPFLHSNTLTFKYLSMKALHTCFSVKTQNRWRQQCRQRHESFAMQLRSRSHVDSLKMAVIVDGNAELFKSLYKSIGRYYSGRRRWRRRCWRGWRRGRRWFLLQHDVLDIEIDLLLVQRRYWLQTESLEGLQLALIIIHLLVVLEVYIFGREYLCKRHALNTLDTPTARLRVRQ